MFTPFQNEPLVNFNEEGAQQKMQDALSNVATKFDRAYPYIINGKRIESSQRVTRRNPANMKQVVGQICQPIPEDVDKAVQAATDAFASWSRLSPEVRARYLVKTAAILRRRSFEFAAWMVYEVSKSWAEAYADVAEAIDFLEFYAREAVRWGEPHPTTPWPGEENEVRYIPIGVGAIITPWNFPLAIMVGMTASAIVTGNTVVLKPAEQSSVIAYRFYTLLEQANLPPGVVNFLPGPGEVIGEALTGHPGIHFVSFTGSRDVGLHIYQRIATHVPGQRCLKRGILEMGGKDAIIIDEGVNLDIAAAEVVQSAFGFQGQKCSACSRLIVHTNLYDALLPKVVERASRLTVGDPSNQSNTMGAVIDSEAYHKIQSYISIGRIEGTIELGGEDSPEVREGGYFVAPCIITGVSPKSRLAQEEIFGPVLTVLRADNFDHALEIANDTDYGLTGAVYSYNRQHLERARNEFQVGNLYLNRKCTGALVDVQPFGGFKLSGTDSKAGGRDYLGHFLQAKSISERF